MWPFWSLVLSSFLPLCLGWLARIACKSHRWAWLPQPKVNQLRGDGAKSKPKYQLTMGLFRSKKSWLLHDDNYVVEHRVRQKLLETRKPEVTGFNPIAESSAEELLDLVVENLTDNYPEDFKRIDHGIATDRVEVAKTGEIFHLRPPHRKGSALETAGQLAMEDFNILIKGPCGNHVLQGSVTCYPIGWSVDARLGWPLYKIHSAVPAWEERLRKPVEHFLSTVSTKASVERNPYFVQVANLERMDLANILCQVIPLPEDTNPTNPEHVVLRRERQTFRRLPKSGAVIFSVKTCLQKLTELNEDELRVFRKDVTSWPDDVALYKGRNGWGDCALKYVSRVLDH